MPAEVSKAAYDGDSGVEADVQRVETTRNGERDAPSIGLGAVSETARGGGDKTDLEGGPIDPAAEKKLVWKCDLHVLPSITVLYFLAFMDRTNIGAF